MQFTTTLLAAATLAIGATAAPVAAPNDIAPKIYIDKGVYASDYRPAKLQEDPACVAVRDPQYGVGKGSGEWEYTYGGWKRDDAPAEGDVEKRQYGVGKDSGEWEYTYGGWKRQVAATLEDWVEQLTPEQKEFVRKMTAPRSEEVEKRQYGVGKDSGEWEYTYGGWKRDAPVPDELAKKLAAAVMEELLKKVPASGQEKVEKTA